jgi:hypothetical protein
MKKFNLERALAGEPVVTRNGKKVTELHLFKNEILIQPLYGTIEGVNDVLYWTTKGIYNPTKESSWDLFMAGEKKSRWVNVYDYGDTLVIGDARSESKEEAVISKYEGFKYIKTIEITNEP